MLPHRYIPLLSLIIAAVLITGCNPFTTRYDETRKQNLIDLQNYHINFIEKNTRGDGKSWNEASVKQACSQGEEMFKSAHQYALSTDNDDKTSSKAVKGLNEQFTSDCDMLLKRKKLFSPILVEGDDGLLSEIKKQYQYAIKGEDSRLGK